MKQKLLSVRCLALMAFLAICSLGIAQVPGGFPTMPNTGNAAADAEAYEQAKQVWIQNNPSSPVNNGNSAPVIATTTEAQNAAYEAAKIQAAANPAMPADERAARQLRQLELDFNLHQAEWANSNERLHAAYVSVFTMARGQTVVTISAQEYAGFHPELKALVDANSGLFNVTQ